MVRLKVSKKLNGLFQKKFQFHYGTIKRILCWLTLAVTGNFNSTMVRLKDMRLTTYPTLNRISIPLWYD